MFFYFKVTLMAHLLGDKNHEPIFVALDFLYFLYTLCNHWHELERQIGQELCSLVIKQSRVGGIGKGEKWEEKKQNYMEE